MYKVKTHNNSKEYFNNLIIEKETLYITANSSISQMIIENKKLSLNEKVNVMDIENFINMIYPIWNDTMNQIRLKAVLRSFLLEMKSKETVADNIKVLNYLNDNISILLSDFRYLYESGIRHINETKDDVKSVFIRKIYNDFINDEYFKKVSQELSSNKVFECIGDSSCKYYIGKVKKSNEDRAKKEFEELKKYSHNIKRIYFYNLSNIDLKRYMLIESLRVSGYEIEFRIPYYEDIPVLNKCWDMVYKDKDLFEITIDKDYCTPTKRNIKYINFLNGMRTDFPTDEDVVTKSYKEVYDFKKDIKDDCFITFYKGSINASIDRSKIHINEHCYQTAIGKFLLNLYKCGVEDSDVKLDFSMFREMITSGWIDYKEWNGTKLKAYLIDNEEYFSGVKSINEIIQRIYGIKEICEVCDIFESQSKSKIGNNKTKAFLANPFKCLSYINTDKYDITVAYLLETTLKLKRSILKLYNNENQYINIEMHFNDLYLLFNNKYMRSLYVNGTDIEKVTIKKIYQLLKNPDVIGKRVYKDDLSEMISLKLLFASKSEEKENDFSIDQLEGVILRDSLFKNYKILHISDLSYQAYKEYSDMHDKSFRVMSQGDIKYLIDKNLIGQNKISAFQALKLQYKSEKSYQSYIKFALGNLFINFNGRIEFSWIKGIRRDDTESIIFKQIESIYKNHVYVSKGLDSKEIDIDELDRKYIDYSKTELYSSKKNIPEVAALNLDFCGDKFLFSSIINDYPIYKSDFHQRLVFAELVGILKDGIEDGVSNIKKYLFPLFPQWQDVEKTNILDCEYVRKKINDYKYFDGMNYPKEMDKLYLLKSRYIVGEKNKIRNRYNDRPFTPDKYFNEFIDDYITDAENHGGRHCMMCPYCFVCREGEFIIDSI